MRNGVEITEIHDNGQKDKNVGSNSGVVLRNEVEIEIHDNGQKDKNVGSNSEGVFCATKICSNPRIWGQTEKIPCQSHDRQISKPIKKPLLVDKSMECSWDRLPDDIVQDILSRISILELLRAKLTCKAWHTTISSCNRFHLLYDGRNQESWIAVTSNPQNANYFCLVNNNPSQWYYIQGSYHWDLTTSWLLLGAADGLMLFISTEGKLVVRNPLTRRNQQLLDTKVSPRLWLQSCLKKKLQQNISTPSKAALSSLSIHLVVDADKFKVMVWGELRSNMVHALVYSSATDEWTVQSCPDVDYRLFRRPFHSTADGQKIFYTSVDGSMLATYNTESGTFVAEHRFLLLPQWQLGMVMEWVQNITLLVHKSRVYLLGIIIGYRFMGGLYSTLLGLWQADSNGGHWDLVTTHTLQSALFEAPPAHDEVAAAYDGAKKVTIIPKTQGLKVRFLNLDTKEWTVSDEDGVAGRLSDGNAPQEQITFSAPFMAFHMKLKFCTAI